MVSFAGKAKASKPGQAGTPTITSQSSGQVGISWTAPSFSGGAPITDYKIEYSSNSGSTWTEWNHTPSTATSATVTGLPDYLTYEFRVTAKNAVGLGTASTKSAGVSQFNAASGGTESTVSNYNGTGQTWKVHTFTSNGTFTMSRNIVTCRVLVVGGGAGGGECGFGGGGGGVYTSSTQAITVGARAATIGGAGSPGRDGNNGSGGGTTTFDVGGSSITATGGTGGYGFWSNTPALNATPGGTPNGAPSHDKGYSNNVWLGTSSDILGSGAVMWAGGGGGGGAPYASTAGSGGAGYCGNGSTAGIGGIVIVAYRIA